MISAAGVGGVINCVGGVGVGVDMLSVLLLLTVLSVLLVVTCYRQCWC